jgi:catechol 2,3-dioxygenase-like lactoylglutathione lyase family enzyme
MRIGVTEIPVDDEDKARRFYAEVLGLQVRVDVAYAESAYWLTLVSPDEPAGTQLLLGRATEVDLAVQQARREAGMPALSLITDNCRATYEDLRARGVSFLGEPQQMSYGGIDAVFEDGCGNLLNPHQDAGPPGEGR